MCRSGTQSSPNFEVNSAENLQLAGRFIDGERRGYSQMREKPGTSLKAVLRSMTRLSFLRA